MAIPQPNYREGPDRGFPGMVANGETSNRISRTVEDAAGLPFGAAAFEGAGDRGCTRVPSADFIGFAIADHGVQPLPGGVAADIYPRYASAALMVAGPICVTTSVNVAKRDPVYVTPAGLITNVDGGGANFRAQPADGGAPFSFDETVAAGGVVRVVRR
jgi:hypothetical protein